jgi:hypothetical protein
MEFIELALSERLGREVHNPVTERIRQWLAQQDKAERNRRKAGKPARRKARERGIKV